MSRCHTAARLLELARLLGRAAVDVPPKIDKAADVIADALIAGNKVLVCGNGGSAAQAQHFAAELVGRYRKEPARRGYPAIALTADTSVLTCVANDFGYATVFARQVEALGRRGDVLVALSTSGSSPNVLAALRAAVERGMDLVVLTSTRCREPWSAWSTVVRFPTEDTGHVQELTLTALHAMCERIEERLLAAESQGAA